MKLSPEFKKVRAENPIYNSQITIGQMMIALETHLFKYTTNHNTAPAKKYIGDHLPEIRRLASIIKGIEDAYAEHSKIKP